MWSEFNSHIPLRASISRDTRAKNGHASGFALFSKRHFEKQRPTLPPQCERAASHRRELPSMKARRIQSPTKSACALQSGGPRSTRPATTHRGQRPQWHLKGKRKPMTSSTVFSTFFATEVNLLCQQEVSRETASHQSHLAGRIRGAHSVLFALQSHAPRATERQCLDAKA